MYCIDFEYDNQKLSDYGCIVCHMSSSADMQTIDIGSQITFNTIQQRDKFKKMSTKYENAYTATFEIGKYDCDNPDNHTFTQEEASAIMRWLNKKQYCKFKMIYRGGEFANVYYMGFFNVKMITLSGDIVGFELTLQTDASYGYYDEVSCELEFLTGGENEVLSIYDMSDEIGYIYPKNVRIECLADGELSIHNSQDGLRSTVIKNCIAGEILTLDGENRIITSSESHVRLYNDFNYNYIRISNKNESTLNDIENIFTASLPCKISFTYSPICKVGIV